MIHIAEYTCTECGFHGEFDFFFQEYIYCEHCRRQLYLVKVTKPATEEECDHVWYIDPTDYDSEICAECGDRKN
jgi:hypothetical protein